MPTKTKQQTHSAKSGKKSGQLVPQPHGGALRYGSEPGNTPGTGRPREHVRERLVELARGKGIAFLDRLLDGKIAVRLVGVCEHCGKESPRKLSSSELVAIAEGIEASADQRLKGLDMSLRYGVGTKDELDIKSHPAVQHFVSVHAQATREIAGDATYRLIAERIQQELAA